MLETGVYCIKNKLNDKTYIGSTMSGFNKRFQEHIHYLRNNNHHSKYLQRAFNKYGESNFVLKILHRTPPEYCRKLEQLYLKRNMYDYNASQCATGGLNQNTIDRDSLIDSLEIYSRYKGNSYADSLKGTNLNSDKLSRILSGKSYSYYNISEDLIEKCKSVRDKCSNTYWKGKKRSAKDRRKISEKLKGKKNLNLSIEVICINDGKKYSSLEECSIFYNIAPTNISLCCRGEISNCKGLNFAFVDEYIFKSRVNEKKVVCLEDGKIFDNAKIASSYYEAKPSLIRSSCNKERKTNTKYGKKSFRYEEKIK